MAFSLVCGGVLAPLPVRADLLFGLFGNNVSASTDASSLGENSQNIELLQANVSSAAIIADKKSKNKKDNLDDDKDPNIVSDTALSALTCPTGVSDGSDDGDLSSDQISVYVVRKGDSIAQIAEMYGVSSNTILWANDLKKGEKLTEGDVLIILPVSGVKVTVAKGQTLKSLATKYKVDASDIASFNGIAPDAKLAVGDDLIIPDGVLYDEGGDKPIKSAPASSKGYNPSKLANITGYFMNPMPGSIITQLLHDRGGIDLAAPKGTPILAAASGTVIFARNGYNGGYGNMVIIAHPNGTQTLYGHQSKITTHVGDQVYRGEIIGHEGSTGRSTGPHLHFKITGARNPGAICKVGSRLDANWN